MQLNEIGALAVIIVLLLFAMCVVCVIVAAIMVCLKECCDGHEKIYDYSLDSVVVDDSYSYENNNIYYDEETTGVKIGRNSCDFCGDDFVDSFHLSYHHKATHFAKCRLEKYKQVRLSDSAKEIMNAKCKEARLHTDIYHKCREAVIGVLTKMLSHHNNGGRFCKIPDREGSTKTGLKTRKPVEFDFSVKVLLHETPDFIFGVEAKHEVNGKYDIWYNEKIPPCSAQLRLKSEDVQRFNDCCSSEILSPSALKRAFYLYMKRTRNVGIDGVKVNVSKLQNGPAVRLIIKHHAISHEIDVDVTPKIIIPFKHESHGFDWPRSNTYEFLSEKRICQIKNHPLYLVAKKEKYWSISFANYENAVLNTFQNTSTEKNILRCMKVKLEAWRTQSPVEMKLISSYMLKEVFFWLRENMPENYFWTPDKCADRYCNFLEELKFCFKHMYLSDYFFPSTDLLAGKEISQSKIIQYLDRELELIQKDKYDM